MAILAIDPGGTTGWALFESNTLITSGQVPTDEVWEALSALYTSSEFSRLVVERFVYRQRTNINFDAPEIIGVIKEWARQNRIGVTWQTPSQVKHFFTNERLKEMGVYQKGKPHANDAIRHALYFVMFGKGRKA